MSSPMWTATLCANDVLGPPLLLEAVFAVALVVDSIGSVVSIAVTVVTVLSWFGCAVPGLLGSSPLAAEATAGADG